jgi:hypothetical protein
MPEAAVFAVVVPSDHWQMSVINVVGEKNGVNLPM